MAGEVRVALEIGPKGKKVVAVAQDWPGLSRGARTAEDAIERLRAYIPRYAPVATAAGMAAAFAPDPGIVVVEQYPGVGSTDFWGISFAFSHFDQQAMPQDELLARLLFGTSITQLSAPEAIQLAAAVTALQGGGGGLDPINAIRRATGLSRLRILPADATTGQKTSIAAGKNIGRLYVELITDGQGYSATRVEFQITRWLSLLSTVSTVGRQSVGARVSKDY